MTAAAAPEKVTRFKDVCRKCGRTVSRASRRRMTWRCPHCKHTNPGPGLTEQLLAPQEPGTGSRRRRRAAVQDQAGDQVAASSPPPAAAAPVRRKRTPAAPTPAPKAPPASTPAPQGDPPPRRGLLDRIWYGGDDDDGEQ
jgi:ribosomal protein L37AE/L43A